MVFKVKIPPEKRALAIYLRKETGASYPKIGQNFFSRAHLQRIFRSG